MTDLPQGWVKTTLGELGKWSSGGTPSRKNPAFYGGEIQWVKTGDLNDSYLDCAEETITEDGLKKSSAKVFPAGTLLIAMYGATIGRTAVLRTEAATNQACAAFLPNGLTSQIIPFVWWYVRANIEEFRSLGQGGAQPNISQTLIKSFPIYLPPIAEQRRIVAKLDSLFERTRRAREELAHVPTLIEHYKQAILAAAFRGDLTADWRKQQQEIEPVDALLSRTSSPAQPRGGREATDTTIEGRAALSVNIPDRPAPPGWSWVSLMRIARQETGHTPSRKHPEYWDGDIPWIGIRDAGDHHGGIIMDTIQHVTEEGLENSSARLLPKDTVCLSRTASVGYVIKMGREMATSQDFATWTCSEALDPDYLLYALLAEGDDIRRFGKGSTHTTIYFPEIRALHLCLAPLEEQHEIVRRVRAALAWVDRIAREQYQAYDLIPLLEQTLLSKAFQGELVPQDPDDEPASALLESIRAAQADSPNLKSRGRKPRKNAPKNNSEVEA